MASMQYQLCLKCQEDKELSAALKIGRILPSVHVLVPIQEKHKSAHGARDVVWKLHFPGCVFRYANEPVDEKALNLVPDR